MQGQSQSASPAWWDVGVRAALFLGVWLVLTGFSPTDLLVGLPAAGAAVWVSFVLLPPGLADTSARGVLRQALRLPMQSFLAGIEVAKQAFLAKPTLKPGIVSCRITMPEGIAREAFLMLASLQPGTLPVDEAGDGTVRLQAIDLDEDVPACFGREEARFMSEVCPTQGDGKGRPA